jgi:hypothetical protein
MSIRLPASLYLYLPFSILSMDLFLFSNKGIQRKTEIEVNKLAEKEMKKERIRQGLELKHKWGAQK